MESKKKLNGRPLLKDGKRTKIINVRFTQEEFDSLLELEEALGISRTELVRMRVLENADKIVVNSKALIKYLDHIGAELGRVGNNINQLAKHANTLRLLGSLTPFVAEKFNLLFEEYIATQQTVEVALRKIIRTMGK
jgi:hypothetical protein